MCFVISHNNFKRYYQCPSKDLFLFACWPSAVAYMAFSKSTDHRLWLLPPKT